MATQAASLAGLTAAMCIKGASLDAAFGGKEAFFREPLELSRSACAVPLVELAATGRGCVKPSFKNEKPAERRLFENALPAQGGREDYSAAASASSAGFSAGSMCSLQ